MSPIARICMVSMIVLGGWIGPGCGSSSPNGQLTYNNETEKHTAKDWLPAGHMLAARIDNKGCTECHGIDYLGGVSAVSCSRCHLGGEDHVHPVDWIGNMGSKHGQYVTEAHTTAACATTYCHGVNLEGVSGSGRSCSECH